MLPWGRGLALVGAIALITWASMVNHANALTNELSRWWHPISAKCVPVCSEERES